MNGTPARAKPVTVHGYPGTWRIVRRLRYSLCKCQWCGEVYYCPLVVLRRVPGDEELRARECQVREVKP